MSLQSIPWLYISVISTDTILKKHKFNMQWATLLFMMGIHFYHCLNIISESKCWMLLVLFSAMTTIYCVDVHKNLTIQRFSRAGPRGRASEWATLGVHPLSWLLSNNQLEKVCGTLTKGTFSSPLLLSNQDKGCTPSVAHSLPLPFPSRFLLNLSTVILWKMLWVWSSPWFPRRMHNS